MSDSKILMLPEYGYGNNANNLGLGGWGGGILGFILGILLGNNGIGGFGGFGGGYGVANQLNNDNNTGFTFTNSDYKMSIVCIGKASSRSQFVSTVVHEAKHVQSHICSFYGVDENSEEAAYLIGYIVKRMYIGITNIY